MESEENLNGQGVQSFDDFLTPTQPAAGTEGGPGGAFIPPRPAPTPHQPVSPGSAEGTEGNPGDPEPAPRLFGPDQGGSDDIGGPKPEDKHYRKWSRGEEDDAINMFLNFRSMLQGKLAKMIVGDPDYRGGFFTEDEIEQLGPWYRPYAAKYGNVIPPWVWLIGAEVMIMLPKGDEVFKTRSVNLENARIMARGEVKTRSAREAQEEDPGSSATRKKFVINAQGYYACTEKGAYLKQALQKEKASLADIDKIVRDSSRDIVRLAFPEVDLSKYPPEEE